MRRCVCVTWKQEQEKILNQAKNVLEKNTLIQTLGPEEKERFEEGMVEILKAVLDDDVAVEMTIEEFKDVSNQIREITEQVVIQHREAEKLAF